MLDKKNVVMVHYTMDFVTQFLDAVYCVFDKMDGFNVICLKKFLVACADVRLTGLISASTMWMLWTIRLVACL